MFRYVFHSENNNKKKQKKTKQTTVWVASKEPGVGRFLVRRTLDIFQGKGN